MTDLQTIREHARAVAARYAEGEVLLVAQACERLCDEAMGNCSMASNSSPRVASNERIDDWHRLIFTLTNWQVGEQVRAQAQRDLAECLANMEARA